VLFTEWIPDAVPISIFSCTYPHLLTLEYNHMVCTVTTPNIVLSSNGFVHLFRIEFSENTIWDNAMGYSSNMVYQDFPCLMTGANLSAVPYVRCDLVTWKSGPYALETTPPGSYINVYGFSQLPANSLLTI
jgi:hypothetical protein